MKFTRLRAVVTIYLCTAMQTAAFTEPPAADKVTARSVLSKRDLINCPTQNLITYDQTDALVRQLNTVIYTDGNDFNLNSGQNGAYQYDGAFLTYCNYGYGSHIDAQTAGQYLLEMIDTCWTQQGQDSNASEAGQYIMYEGSEIVGYVCVSGAKNPKSGKC
jgi:hypothetical protein